ncbi:hypothetical protein D3C72_1665590 [compost metagenome]
MVRGDAHQYLAAVVDEQEFRLAAAGFAADLDLRRGAQPLGGDAVEHWRVGWALHAKFFQLADMGFHGLDVAAGPSGHHQLADGDGALRFALAAVDIKGKGLHVRGLFVRRRGRPASAPAAWTGWFAYFLTSGQALALSGRNASLAGITLLIL